MGRCAVVAALVLAAAGCAPDPPRADPPADVGDTAAAAIPAGDAAGAHSGAGATADRGEAFFREARALDLTGAGARDSVVLTAGGARLDSLTVRMTFYADGRDAYSETWNSSYELALEDSVRAAGNEAMAAFLRARFAEELAAVERRPFDRAELEVMGDTTVLREFASPVTHEVAFSYGYETTVVLAYDADDRVFRVLRSCC